MKNLLGFVFILFTINSCIIRPGRYYSNYTPTFTPTITPIIPTYNPYLYRPFPTYNYYYRPYNHYYNPRPRTTVIINPPSHQNPRSGPRGGRRK